MGATSVAMGTLHLIPFAAATSHLQKNGSRVASHFAFPPIPLCQQRDIRTFEGSGVPPDELETIFEPFYRGKKSGSQSGYGLGLTMTCRVIQAHGGKVTAKNRAEGGLAIVIVLPVAGA